MPEVKVQSFVYSPIRSGYDNNVWETLAGSPAITGGGRLQFDPTGTGESGTAIHYADILKGDIDFDVNIPAVPGTVNSAIFGLYSPNTLAYIVFTIGGGGMTCDTSNGITSDHSSAILWNTDWTGVAIHCRIRWEAGLVKYFINGSCVYTVAGACVPARPLSLYCFDDAGAAAGLSFGDITVRGSQSIYLNPKTTDASSFSGSLETSSKITVTDVPTIFIPILKPSVSDNVVVVDSPSVLCTSFLLSVNDGVAVTDLPGSMEQV